MHKKYFHLLLILLLTACTQTNTKKEERKILSTQNNSISQLRTKVDPEPVASYHVPMGDPKLDRKFGVEIYETPETFKFLLAMQYDGMFQDDTLTIPNFGVWPVIEIKPGPDRLSCIIGFLDEKKEFREYKSLSAKGNKLKLITLKSYGVDSYTK